MPSSAYYHKPKWRNRNIEFYEKRGVIRDGYFPCSYLELLGDSGIESYRLLQSYFRDPCHFIGVDQELGVIASYRGLPNPQHDPIEKPEFQVVWRTNAYSWAVDLCKSDQFQPPIGVFNFDDTIRAGNQGRWGTNLGLIASLIARVTVKRLGSCSVLLNATLDSPDHMDPVGLLIDHANMISTYLRLYKWSGIDAIKLTGSDAELRQLESPQYTGNVGSFDIYKSDHRILRMATIRLHFSGNLVVAHKSPPHLYWS